MSDIYVNISDIDGEATAVGYDGQIKCESMRHAIAHEIMSTGARKVGNSRHGAIELTHSIDKATPMLHEAAANANNLGRVTITRLSSAGLAETITLSNVYVVRVDIDTPLDAESLLPDDQEPVETFALEYSQIEWDYKWYVDGADQGTVSGGWNTQTGIPV